MFLDRIFEVWSFGAVYFRCLSLLADFPPNCDVRIHWGVQYKLQLHRWVKSVVSEEEPSALGSESG